MELSLSKLLIESLIRYIKVGTFRNSDYIASMYISLFKAYIADCEKGAEDFDEILLQYYNQWDSGDEGKEWFFHSFHKSIRQNDFFQNAYAVKPNGYLSVEDTKRRNEILEFFSEERNRRGIEGIEDDDQMWWENRKMNKEFKNLRQELYELNSKLHSTQQQPISGLLDVLLHDLISMDKNILFDTLVEVFEDYKINNKKKNKGNS